MENGSVLSCSHSRDNSMTMCNSSGSNITRSMELDITTAIIDIESENIKIFKYDLPCFVFLLLLSVVGTFGNLHAVFVYYFKFEPTNHRVAVIVLALVDLVNCSISMPFDLLDIRFNHIVITHTTCRLFLFIDHIISLSSITLLAIIALERHRKVCSPLKRQVSHREFLIICVVSIVVSIFLSLFAVFMYHRVIKENNGYQVKVCEIDPLRGPRAYLYVTILLMISFMAMCTICYISIGRRIVSFRKNKRINVDRGYVKCSDTQTQEESVSESVFTTTKCENVTVNPYSGKSSKKWRFESLKRKRQMKSIRQTLIFLVATFISYIAVLTTVVILILRNFVPNLPQILGQMFGILYRFHYINNATNPIVYCLMHRKFKEECKLFYKRLFKLA